jgi:thiamine-phosphate pyrophosphorylase
MSVRGLYAITPECPDTGRLVGLVRQTLQGGASLVQYRAKRASPELKREQAKALSGLCQSFAVPLIINDEVELAVECGAQGVHLGRDDAAPALVRQRLGRGEWLVGVSCYNQPALAVAAWQQGADYVALGSFFPSATKPDAVRATLENLRATRQQVPLPVVAIGGITLPKAPALIEAGAHALAVITALFEAPQVEEAAREFCHLMESRS